MPYQQLVQTPPEILTDRVYAIETDLIARETPGLVGTHIYAAECVPLVLTSGTDTAGIAGQLWISELRINANILITGLSFLIGSVGGTDKVIVQLYDSNGNILATSALAGATVGTAATFQRVALITPYKAGPGLYYVAVQYNGVTAKLRTVAAGDHNAGVVSQTFGTPVAIAVPTTFTAASAPYLMTY